MKISRQAWEVAANLSYCSCFVQNMKIAQSKTSLWESKMSVIPLYVFSHDCPNQTLQLFSLAMAALAKWRHHGYSGGIDYRKLKAVWFCPGENIVVACPSRGQYISASSA